MNVDGEPWVLLASARDTGAAVGLTEVLAAARDDDRFDIHVAATWPASSYLERRGIKVRHPGRAKGKDALGVDALRRWSRDLVDEFRPDAILVGLSGHGAGVDEVLAEAAGGIPTYALQDFWGDVNDVLGVLPQTFLVMDERAATLTRARADVETFVVGSVKHADYGAVDVDEFRRRGRGLLGVAERGPVVTFYGQPLWGEADYESTVAAVGGPGQLDPSCLLVYRPHPEEDRSVVLARLSRLWVDGGYWMLDPVPDPVMSLCATDLALSVYSTCLVDLLFLTRVSHRPMAVPVFLLFEEGMRARFAQHTRLEAVPPVEAGLARLVGHRADLRRILDESVTSASRDKIWRRAGSTLPDPASAPARVLDRIAHDLIQMP